ncbi:MAG: Dihydrodipicolinate synthase [Halanaerobium sp.]|nr:MAG: Dihydrodipicolinate synthase [Halanaerobium sp.]
MAKRLLSSNSSELLSYSKEELLQSIKLSEGRTIISEVIGEESLFRDVSNAEVAAAFGADILLLNLFDLNQPKFKNIKAGSAGEIVESIKKLTGRPLGINLEPVSRDNAQSDNFIELSSGRKATLNNIEKAVKAGFNMITFTGNPSVGVSNQAIIEAVKMADQNFGDQIIITAGKMHMAGIDEEYLAAKYIDSLISAGTDVILLPAAGTVPGIDVNSLKEIIKLIHNRGKLALTAIGTSQESSEPETIREIALMSKMAGADIQHIGDAAYGGIAIPENILSLSKTIRGKRHSYRRMALSINR